MSLVYHHCRLIAIKRHLFGCVVRAVLLPPKLPSPGPSGEPITTGKPSVNTQTHCGVNQRLIFERSPFIRISIPSQPNKWTAFSDIKLIAKLAMGCCARQALLSQWKCNLCSANEEELPCHDSNTQHWKEHVALTATPRFDEYQAANRNIYYLLCGTYFLV